MDAQTFLDNFATIADAPGGVQRLRDLVLELAVSGRLIEQSASDGSAEDLLALISERALVSDSKLIVPIGTDDGPWGIPPTWRWARLKQVTDFSAGRTPPTKDPTYWADTHGNHWVSIGDMPDGGTVAGTKRKVTDKAVAEIFGQEPDPSGTLLMSFKLTIGKVARLAVPAFHNEAIVSITTPFEPTSEYLFRTLPLLTKGGASKAAIMGDTLNKTSLTNLPVPIPPLAEQERIVAKVDELMGLCDDLEARQGGRRRATTRFRSSALHALTEAETPDDLRHAWDRASTNWHALTAEPEASQAMRETILDLAVQGRLVGQSHSDGNAGSEIEQARRAKASIPGLRKQPPIDPVHSTVPLPTGWAWAAVDDLFLVTGGIQKSSKRRPTQHHFPYLRVANVQRGRLDLREIERFELVDGELERLRLQPGDLLVVEGNGSESEIGRCARWNGEIEDCVHQNHLIRCRPMLPGVEHYLLMFLNSPAGMATMKRLAVTTSGLYNLSVGKIRAISFPLPPMAEQARIREKVDSLLQQVLTLETSLEARDSVHEALAEAAVALVSA